MNETFIPVSDYTKRKWYVIDCKGKQLGRIATVVSSVLAGKTNSYYHPSFDTGDYVILINALPQRIIENCIFGMMPNGMAKKQLAKRLKIYEGPQHPHGAQTPIELNNFD